MAAARVRGIVDLAVREGVALGRLQRSWRTSFRITIATKSKKIRKLNNMVRLLVIIILSLSLGANAALALEGQTDDSKYSGLVASKLRSQRSLLTLRSDLDNGAGQVEAWGKLKKAFKKKTWKKAGKTISKTAKAAGKGVVKAANSVANFGAKLIKCLKSPIKCMINSLTPKSFKRKQNFLKGKTDGIVERNLDSMRRLGETLKDLVAGVKCAKHQTLKVPTGITKGLKVKYARTKVCMKPTFKLSKTAKDRATKLLEDLKGSKIVKDLLSLNERSTGGSLMEEPEGYGFLETNATLMGHRCNPKRLGAYSVGLSGEISIVSPKKIGVGLGVGINIVVGCDPVRGMKDGKYQVLDDEKGEWTTELRWEVAPSLQLSFAAKPGLSTNNAITLSWGNSFPNANPEYEQSFFVGDDNIAQASVETTPLLDAGGFKKPNFKGVSLEIPLLGLKNAKTAIFFGSSSILPISFGAGLSLSSSDYADTSSSEDSSLIQADETAQQKMYVSNFVEHLNDEWVHESNVSTLFENPEDWAEFAEANKGHDLAGSDGGQQFLEIGGKTEILVGNLGVAWGFSGTIASKHGFFACYTKKLNQHPNRGC